MTNEVPAKEINLAVVQQEIGALHVELILRATTIEKLTTENARLMELLAALKTPENPQ